MHRPALDLKSATSKKTEAHDSVFLWAERKPLRFTWEIKLSAQRILFHASAVKPQVSLSSALSV